MQQNNGDIRPTDVKMQHDIFGIHNNYVNKRKYFKILL